MEMPVHQIVDMTTVGHGFVATVRTVLVFSAVCFTLMAIAALRRVRRIYIESVLIDVALMQRVEVSVVQVVSVAIVNDGSMAAVPAVLMWVVSVDLVLVRHG
jgi:hypothetical protein